MFSVHTKFNTDHGLFLAKDLAVGLKMQTKQGMRPIYRLNPHHKRGTVYVLVLPSDTITVHHHTCFYPNGKRTDIKDIRSGDVLEGRYHNETVQSVKTYCYDLLMIDVMVDSVLSNFFLNNGILVSK